jgi:hypothetical protein
MGWDGFDSVELVMDVEDTFGISIPDLDAERIHRVNELCDYIARRVHVVDDGPAARCAGAAAFYETRRRLTRLHAIERRAVRPTTPTELLLPRDPERRRLAWRGLGAQLGVNLPALDHPLSIRRAAGVAALTMIVLAFTVGLRLGGSIFGLCLVGVLVAPAAIMSATRSLAVVVPAECATIGQVSSLLMRQELDSTLRRSSGWTKHEVYEIVRCLTAKSAGCTPAQITRETNFMRDLS